MILLESKIILLTWPGLHRRTCGLAKCWRHGMLIATGCVLPLGVDWHFTSVLHLANNAPASAGVNRRARSRWCGVAWGTDLSRQKTFDDVLMLSTWEKPRQNQLDDVGCDMDITAWQLAWSVLIQIMPPNLRLGGLCEPDLIKEGTAKSRRRAGRSELDPWNFSKVERCWKADKTWEVQKASAKCKLPGLCICRWHQHMQLARPAFCQKTQNSAGTWFDFPICRVVERLFAKWSYTNFVSLYTPAFLTIPDLRDGDKVNAMRKTVMLRQKDVLKSCRFVGSSRELVLLTLDQCGA